jgi:hypothetical protein
MDNKQSSHFSCNGTTRPLDMGFSCGVEPIIINGLILVRTLKDDKRPPWRLENETNQVLWRENKPPTINHRRFEKFELELGYDGVKDDGINRLSSSKDCYV